MPPLPPPPPPPPLPLPLPDSAAASTTNNTTTAPYFEFPLPREYAAVNMLMPDAYSDYEKLEILWNPCDHYEIVKKIGRGKYSDVFEGRIVKTNSRCVIKILKPSRGSKIRREIKILNNLAGGTNVISLLDCVMDSHSGVPSLVFEYVGDCDFKTAASSLSPADVSHYMFELLKALDFCHSRGIMHRDVKPHNIVINTTKKHLRLIDWGLSEFYKPGTPYNVRVASRYYKGPELLVDLREYHYALDMWSFGCILASLIFKIDPFFPGSSNDDVLVKITEILGTDELVRYLKKYRKRPPVGLGEKLYNCSGVKWEDLCDVSNTHFVSEEVIDLIDNTLRFDHNERLTPREAMIHPYFSHLVNRSANA